MRVARRLLDEAHHGRVEGLVRVVDQQVALAQRLPQPPVLLDVREVLRDGRREPGEHQPLDVERRELHQVRRVDEVLHLDHVGLVEFEFVEQQLAMEWRQPRRAFERDGVGEAPPLDLALDQLAQVLGGLAGGAHLGAAQHAYQVPADDLDAREKQPEVRPDDLLERYEAPAAEVEEARAVGRHLDAREARHAVALPQAHGQREAGAGDERERGARGRRRAA